MGVAYSCGCAKQGRKLELCKLHTLQRDLVQAEKWVVRLQVRISEEEAAQLAAAAQQAQS